MTSLIPARQMRFYLGTHMPNWLEETDVPLFVSRRRFLKQQRTFVEPRPEDFEEIVRSEAEARELRKVLPRARGAWALDSGGFTELSLFGEWRTSEEMYVADVRRLQAEVGRLDWVAPQDWMCEPFMLAKTGMTVQQHQRRTIENFLRLRQALGRLVIPVLQGWTVDDYLRCWDLYHRVGVDLEWENVVGLGTVCRRQNTAEAGLIVRRLADNLLGRQLHGFGVKLTGLESFGDELGSADSMAWSFRARNDSPLPGCTHKSCANCPRYAMRWRQNLLERLGQQRLEVVA